MHADTLKEKSSNTQMAETGRSLGAAEAGLEFLILFFLPFRWTTMPGLNKVLMVENRTGWFLTFSIPYSKVLVILSLRFAISMAKRSDYLPLYGRNELLNHLCSVGKKDHV